MNRILALTECFCMKTECHRQAQPLFAKHRCKHAPFGLWTETSWKRKKKSLKIVFNRTHTASQLTTRPQTSSFPPARHNLPQIQLQRFCSKSRLDYRYLRVWKIFGFGFRVSPDDFSTARATAASTWWSLFRRGTTSYIQSLLLRNVVSAVAAKASRLDPAVPSGASASSCVK